MQEDHKILSMRAKAKSLRILAKLLLPVMLLCNLIAATLGAESWEKLDKQLKEQIFQLNVAIKMYLKDGLYVHLTDLSPKYHFPVFGTTSDDKGFRVVGFGTAFPVKTVTTDKTYFLTNRHVIESGEGIISECQRFFAALRLHAQMTATFSDVEGRYKELLNIINLSQKKDMNIAERAIYQTTVDAVWDTYENYLSSKVDPGRSQFQKYLALAGMKAETGYFLHPPGTITKPALKAELYKVSKATYEPDLALLVVNKTGLPKLELDLASAVEGQEIQVIGYPLASDQIDADSAKYYAPTFSTGRISRVAPKLLHIDAPVSVGNSGGPVISQRGKALGVVVRRAVYPQPFGGTIIQTELPNFGGAITVQSIKAFAPELFRN